MASSEVAGTRCLYFRFCKNININGSYIYSERDQQEEPYGDTSRVSPLGSNIHAICIYSCENMYINNCYFENTKEDFRISHYDENSSKNKNIFISNYVSNNASNNNLVAYTDNLYYTNSVLSPAIDMGNGDHGWYFTNDVTNIHIDNLTYITKDNHFSGIFRTSGDTTMGDLYVSNSYIKGMALISTDYANNLHFENVTFEHTTDGNIIFSGASNASFYFKNCIFKNINNRFYYAYNDNENVYVDGCKFYFNTDYQNSVIQPRPSPATVNGNVIINNCQFYNTTTYLVYIGAAATGFNVKVMNCYVESVTGQLFSKRNTSAKLFISNNVIMRIANLTTDGLYYNGGTDSTGLTMVNVYVSGYFQYASTGTMANGKFLNCYHNDVLIE